MVSYKIAYCDYCSEINTRGIKKEKISSTNYISLITAVRIAFAEDLLSLADGRTERVFHDDNKFQNTLKENQFLHNGGCAKEETNYHFNCVIRLGKLPFVLFAQIMFFFGPFSI